MQITSAVLSLLLCFALLVGGCSQPKPVKIGFVAGLTGRLADLGTGGRDGALLAIDDLNTAGGIKGARLELLVRDDKSDVQVALKVDRELLDAGVVAIVGHVISSTGLAAAPLMNSRQAPMLSPTVRTAQLTGIDDYFFSLITPIWPAAEQQARFAFRSGIRKMTLIYDLNNRQYGQDWTSSFARSFTLLGGQIASTLTVSSVNTMDYADISQKIEASGANGVLLVTGAVDTAMICQHLRKAGSSVLIFTSSWPVTPEFIKLAGNYANGVVMSSPFDDQDRTASFVDFQKRFVARFGYAPNYAAVHSYEAVRVIADALALNPDPKQLKQTILQQKTFNGLTGPFQFDAFGDTIRGNYLLTIHNGRFEVIE
jgi:branched-chain amino acid transport system substrate-binding protein